MLTEVQGDLFTGDVDAIAHGCNLQGVMGAGVARIVAQKYPEMVPRYKLACEKELLRLGGIMPWVPVFVKKPWLYNLGTQVRPGPDARLDAISCSLALMMKHALSHRIHRVGIPRIGCGIGGLDWWDEVRPTVEMVSHLYEGDVKLVVYTL